MQNRNLIGGDWVGSLSGREAPVTNPATDAPIASVPYGGADDARAAIDAAAEALVGWRATPAMERAKPIRRLADLMMARQEELAELMTLEQGKPLAESRGEIAYAASFIEWAAEEGKRLYGEVIPASHPSKRILVLRQPVGVTAAITPWNFPAAMITRKLGPALASGCTMVIKPAMETPLSAFAIGELAIEAGLPPGVVNVVTGDAKAIGAELLENPIVRKLSFTGSTAVGKLLMAKATHNLTRLSLELGGHAPFIVFDDADLDAAVEGAIASKFVNMGQTCICANRFFVQAVVYDAFAAKLRVAVEALTIGPGTDAGVHVGPLIDDAAVAKVQEHVDDAKAKGAKVLCGGSLAPPAPGLANRFYRPTVLDGLTSDMLINRDETFGPVAPLRRFRDETEAIELANDSIYGLAAYFYTRDAGRLMRVAEALDYGIVGANDGSPSTVQAPFGGMKQSGVGREGGEEALRFFTESRNVCVRIEREE